MRIVTLICFCHAITFSRIHVEELHELQRGNVKVILGAIHGEVSLIRTGLAEGGNIGATQDHFVGEKVLHLSGLEREDYIPAPPLHLTFLGGEKEHLEAAFFLLINGANMSQYEFPGQITGGYCPAILYALGHGFVPRNTHAAMIQRLYTSLPHKFNLTEVSIFLRLSGNPPLLQVALLNSFFDGAYVLSTDLKLRADETDDHGATSLHVAVWMCDALAVGFFTRKGGISNVNNVNGIVMLSDNYGRTPLHYAAIRACDNDVMRILIQSINSSDRAVRKLFGMRDKANRTAIDIARLSPVSESVLALLKVESRRVHFSLDVKNNRESSNTHTAQRESLRKQSAICVSAATSVDSFEEMNYDVEIMNKKERYGRRSPEPDTGGWNECRTIGDSACSVDYDALNNVDVISAANITEEAFLRNYFFNQRPVLLTDHMTTGSSIWAYWRRDDLLSRYGDLQVQSGEVLFVSSTEPAWSVPEPHTTSLRDWVVRCMGNNEKDMEWEQTVYSATTVDDDKISYGECMHWPASTSAEDETAARLLSEDLPRPALFEICSSSARGHSLLESIKSPSSTLSSLHAANDDAADVSYMAEDAPIKLKRKKIGLSRGEDQEPRKLILGRAGSGSGALQGLNASWNVLLSGRRRWYFSAPGQRVIFTSLFNDEMLRIGAEGAEGPREDSFGAAATTTTDSGTMEGYDPNTEYVTGARVKPSSVWLSEDAPTLLKRGALSSVTQYPGDIVFTPHGWMHAYINEVDSIGVSQAICSAVNTNFRTQPMGTLLYGGYDPWRGLGSYNFLKNKQRRYKKKATKGR